MPGPELIAAGRKVGEIHQPIVAGNAEITGVGNVDITAHFVMDVAADRDDSEGIEVDLRLVVAAIEVQLKALGLGKRVNVVQKGIVIGKAHRRAGPHGEHRGIEGFVALPHIDHVGGILGRESGAVEHYDGVAYRLTGIVGCGDRERSGACPLRHTQA